MSSLTRQVFGLSLLALFAGCGQQVGRNTPQAATAVKAPLPDSIIGERIRGRAKVRDKPGGTVLFALADNTVVTCAADSAGWYAVGLYMPIANSEYGTDTLRKGRKIVVSGRVVGKVLNDMYVTTSSTGKESWAELTGYTRKDHIYPYSVIEHALKGYLDTVSSRSLEDFRRFINSFKMERDEALKPYVSYFTYENWMEDPSPLPRVQLVFLENRLAGVVHSRPLTLPHTTGYPLERGFRVLFYNDLDQQTRESFIRAFNDFITSVD